MVDIKFVIHEVARYEERFENFFFPSQTNTIEFHRKKKGFKHKILQTTKNKPKLNMMNKTMSEITMII